MKKVISLKDWSKGLQEKEDDFNGLSPGGAASSLGVTRQTIYNLIKRGDLDRITILDDAGKTLAVLITTSSLIRYRAKMSEEAPDLFSSAAS